MRKYMFVIDGQGVETAHPLDKKVKGKPIDKSFYQLRARFNWDRGCYYMEADLTKDQEVGVILLVKQEEDWLGAKEYVEKITGRNFRTETGYDNPYDPDYEFPRTREVAEAEAERNRVWKERAGLCFFI